MAQSSMTLPRSRFCDVLVLGSGIAGLTAALKAGEMGASVILACRGSLFSGSSFYPGTWGLGLIGPENPGDQEDLIRTILQVGCGMAREELVRGLVEGITPAVRAMEDMGVQLRKAQAGADQKEYIPCFDHKHRAWNGLEFDSCRRVFREKLRAYGVTLLPGWEALELVKARGAVCGAVLSDGVSLQYIGSKALVLATGGYGSLFTHHLCTTDVEGLGQALALDAGCSLLNLEFMQIMPGYLSPAYGTIYNEKVFRYSHLESQGQEILPPEAREDLLSQRSGHGPFTSRLPDRAVDLAIHSTGKGVTVRYSPSLRQDPPEFVKTYFDWLRRAKGLSMEDPITMDLFSHAANGGVAIRTDGSTQVPGLFAAGEVTGGMHGADRIGGLSTANGLVYGGKAGAAAARRAETDCTAPEALEFSLLAASDWAQRFRSLQQIMTAHALVCRSEEGLTQALSQVRSLAAGMDLSPSRDVAQVTGTRRLQGQLKTAQAILLAQLLRRESRGSHYREDFPREDPALARRILVSQQDGSLQARFETE